jgi:hypothetical protein
MLGVTFFGLLLTPLFYVLVRRLTDRRSPTTAAAAKPAAPLPAPEAHHA